MNKIPLSIVEKFQLIQKQICSAYELGYSEGVESAQKESNVAEKTIDNTERVEYHLLRDIFDAKDITLNTDLRTRLGEYLRDTPPIS